MAKRHFKFQMANFKVGNMISNKALRLTPSSFPAAIGGESSAGINGNDRPPTNSLGGDGKNSLFPIPNLKFAICNLKCLLTLAFCLLAFRYANALTLSGGSFSTNPILYETKLPNGTTLSFNIDGDASVDVDIYKVQNVADPGTQVATFTSPFTAGAGKQFYWNALWLIDGDLGRHGGKYKFVLTASTDSATAQLVVPTLLEINSVDIHGVNVTPSQDANRNPAFPYLITYDLAKDAKVTVRVKDNTNSVIRTIINKQPRFSELTVSSNTETWNGVNDDGRPVPVDVYTITVDADDSGSGDTATQRIRTIAVPSLAGLEADPQKLFEDSVFVYPNPVRNGQGIFQFQPIRNNATVYLKIYTLTGDLVRDETFGNLTGGNVKTWSWDVKNQSGQTVGRGLYYYVVREEDPEGALSVTKKMAVLP
jgi:flagellar hook assembly protein FlgD